MAFYTECDRRRLISLYQKNGLSIKAFSRQHGLGSGTLSSWLGKIKSSKNPFIPVTVAKEKKTDIHVGLEPIEIAHVSGVRISCTTNASPEWISSLLKGLS